MNTRTVKTLIFVMIISLLAACGGTPSEVEEYALSIVKKEISGNATAIASSKSVSISPDIQADGIKEAWCVEVKLEGKPNLPIIIYRLNGLNYATALADSCSTIDTMTSRNR